MSELAKNDIVLSEKRLLFTMSLVLALLVGASLFLSNWKVTFGLILGGGLSFLNYFWLKKSLRKLFERVMNGNKGSNFSASFYVFRYAVIGVVIAIAANLDLASVAATLVGLLSFAFAVLLEAIVQLYLVIVNREEN